MAPQTLATTDTKPKRAKITVGERRALRNYHAQFPMLKQSSLAIWFQGSLVTALLRRRYPSRCQTGSKILMTPPDNPSASRLRTAQWPRLEETLLEWQLHYESDVPISGDLIDLIVEVDIDFWHKLTFTRDCRFPISVMDGLTNIKADTAYDNAQGLRYRVVSSDL
ncbi:hypothetical protein E4U40_000821 [Claviceps sp. LM458 group G5]|nr:hypothetical protein E4U40_000821 [Claviceps sp. LM458 group G5]